MTAASIYFVNPFSAPTWGVMGRFTGRALFRNPGEDMEPALAKNSPRRSLQSHRNRLENVAMASDLFVSLVLLWVKVSAALNATGAA